MSNPILLIKDAGHGTTPDCPQAKFKRGDVVQGRGGFEAIVAVAVPPRFPSEYALADLVGNPRPLMISEPSRSVSYILVRENDPSPYWRTEGQLRPSGKPPVEIGAVSMEREG